eukprot:11207399-Lingulodinium_polyedra.AAC.1
MEPATGRGPPDRENAGDGLRGAEENNARHRLPDDPGRPRTCRGSPEAEPHAIPVPDDALEDNEEHADLDPLPYAGP